MANVNISIILIVNLYHFSLTSIGLDFLFSSMRLLRCGRWSGESGLESLLLSYNLN